MLKMLTLSNINNLKCEKYKAFEIVISLNQHVIILRCLCKPCDKNTKIAKTRNNGSTKLPENKKMVIVSPYLSIITLSINGLKSPTKDIKWLNAEKNKIQ